MKFKMKKKTLKERMTPTKEDLERIGCKSESGTVLDKNADPECTKCKGTGQVYTPDRARGGHICPCTLKI